MRVVAVFGEASFATWADEHHEVGDGHYFEHVALDL